MHESQKEAYKQDAINIQSNLHIQGYVSSDIAVIAYYLLEATIDGAETLHDRFANTQQLIERARILIEKDS